MTDLDQLQKRAATIGLRIEEDHVGEMLGYWILPAPWDDDNFSTSLSEVEGKITTLENERGQG